MGNGTRAQKAAEQAAKLVLEQLEANSGGRLERVAQDCAESVLHYHGIVDAALDDKLLVGRLTADFNRQQLAAMMHWTTGIDALLDRVRDEVLPALHEYYALRAQQPPGNAEQA